MIVTNIKIKSLVFVHFGHFLRPLEFLPAGATRSQRWTRFSWVDFDAQCPKLADFYRKSSHPLLIGSACPGFYDFYDLLLIRYIGKRFSMWFLAA